MMLDAKRTFDEIVEWHAPDERTRDAVLSNRIYQELSNAVAGSQEYMAMEKLYELHQEGRYDLLVLDTPPTRNALDFLDAPERLSRFIDSRSLQFFLTPGRLGLKVSGRGSGLVFSVLKRVTGVDLLEDLSEFFSSFGDMAEGFRERAGHVNELLADSRTAFVLVTSPRADAIEEARWFRHRLMDAGMPFAGAVANRVRPAASARRPGSGARRAARARARATRCCGPGTRSAGWPSATARTWRPLQAPPRAQADNRDPVPRRRRARPRGAAADGTSTCSLTT